MCINVYLFLSLHNLTFWFTVSWFGKSLSYMRTTGSNFKIGSHSSAILDCSHWSLLKRKFTSDANVTAQKVKFSINDFFSKCDQIFRKLRIWSCLLKKSWIANFIFLSSACLTLVLPLLDGSKFFELLVQHYHGDTDLLLVVTMKAEHLILWPFLRLAVDHWNFFVHVLSNLMQVFNAGLHVIENLHNIHSAVLQFYGAFSNWMKESLQRYDASYILNVA